MQDRFDILGSDAPHLQHLEGSLLDTKNDEELDAIAAEVAELMGTPIAIVTLILRRVQFFRASHGLPNSLAASRATDRSASFCQLVVHKNDTLNVSHASADPRVPQELVKRYGIEAYLGSPIRVGDVTVGSLCAIDTTPHEFSEKQSSQLAALAERASRRLSELARIPTQGGEIVRRAAGPALADMRNALAPISTAPEHLLQIQVELAAVARLSDSGLNDEDRRLIAEDLQDAPLALADLGELAGELRRGVSRILDNVRGIESLLNRHANSDLAPCIAASNRLAMHHTKLVGGVSWAPIEPTLTVQPPSTIVVAAISCALSELALCAGPAGPLEGEAHRDDGDVKLDLTLVNGETDRVADVGRLVNDLVEAEPGLSVVAHGATLSIRIAIGSAGQI